MSKTTKNILIFAVFGVIGFVVYRWWQSRQAAASNSTVPTINAASGALSGVITSIGNLFKK